MLARTIGTSILLATVALWHSSVAAEAPDVAPAIRQAAAEAIFVDCAGRYIRVAGGGGRIIAEGTLWDDPSMTALRLDSTGGFDGCLVADVRSDPAHGTLYAVLARESRGDREERRHYALVTLDLQGLVRLRQVELDTAVNGGVHIVLSLNGEELIVSYGRHEEAGGQEGWRNVLERYTVPGLTRVKVREDLRVATALSTLPSSITLSNSASWMGGHRILDQNLVLDEDGHVLQRLNPYDLLPAETASQLAPLKKQGAPGRTYLPIAFADAADGRVLFVVGHDLAAGVPAGSALWVYDVEHGVSLRPILTREPVATFDPGARETPTAHLTPDGDSILVESSEWRPVASSTSGTKARFKTGVLNLYNVASGELMHKFSLEPPPGLATRLIGFSPDGAIAFIGSSERLYSVPLDGGHTPTAIRPTKGFDPFWSVGVVFSGH
jgi:hypothetical protein